MNRKRRNRNNSRCLLSTAMSLSLFATVQAEGVMVSQAVSGHKSLTRAYVMGPLEENKPKVMSIKGQVLDTQGIPVIGANVIVKGSTQGVVTDIDGNFMLDVADNSTLLISYIGFETKEVSVKGQTSLQVVLKEDSYSLNEVVVTALGISREKKALGYSVQDLKGPEFDIT